MSRGRHFGGGSRRKSKAARLRGWAFPSGLSFRRLERLAIATVLVAAVGSGMVLTWGGQKDRPRRPIPAPTGTSTTAAVGPSTTGAPITDPLASAADYLATRQDTVSASVFDIDTDQTWTLGGDGDQEAAGVEELTILEAALRQESAGAPTLSAGTVGTLATGMIERGDTASGTRLWEDLGGASAIRSFDVSAGLTQASPSLCISCPSVTVPGWEISTAVPSDEVQLLRQIVGPQSLLSAPERRFAAQLLDAEGSASHWGISASVAPGTQAVVQNGSMDLGGPKPDWQVNSVGWISGQGRDYLAAVFSTANPTEAYGRTTVDHLSADIWQYLG